MSEEFTYRAKQAATEIFHHGRHQGKLLFAKLRHCYCDVLLEECYLEFQRFGSVLLTLSDEIESELMMILTRCDMKNKMIVQ